MEARRDERRPGNDAAADRDWYFDDDGTLAEVDPVPRVAEWLGLGYALIGLTLGSLTWLGLPAGHARGAERAHADARRVA